MNDLDMLSALWGVGVHALCSMPNGGIFAFQGFYEAPGMLYADARRYADDGHDVWFGVNPLPTAPEQGRGRAADVNEVVALYADLDWRDDVHASAELPTQIEVRSVLETFALEPSIVVNTGHGLHVYWLLTTSVPSAVGVELQRRLHLELERRGLAPEREDLASVLRVPGTYNYKRGDTLPVIVEYDGGARWHPVEVFERLEPPEVFPIEESSATIEGHVSLQPGIPRRSSSLPAPMRNDETPAEWFNERQSIRALIESYGWQYHSTDHEGELWTRPGKTTREGWSARVYADVIVVFTKHFPQLCSRANAVGAGWRHDAFEFYAAMEHGGDKQQAASQVRTTMMPKPPLRPPQGALYGPESDETGSGGTSGAGGMRRIQGVSMGHVEQRDLEWLWPGRLPRGKLVVLDGDPSLGKSVLSLDLVARVTTGRGWPDESHQIHTPANALIVTAEDDLRDTVLPRLIAAEANVHRVTAIEAVMSGLYDITGREVPDLLRLPSDTAELERTITDLDAKLVVLDVLVAFMEHGYDMNSDQDVRAILAPLSKVAETTGATILALRHLNKRTGVGALYRGGGSIGITGAARVGLLAGWHLDDLDLDDLNERRKVLAVSKVNVASYSPSLIYRTAPIGNTVRIEWGDTVGYTADDLVTTTQRSKEEAEDRDEADRFLLTVLRGGPMWAKDIFKEGQQAGLTEGQIKRAKKRLKVRSEKGEFQGQWYWILPDDLIERSNDHAW